MVEQIESQLTCRSQTVLIVAVIATVSTHQRRQIQFVGDAGIVVKVYVMVPDSILDSRALEHTADNNSGTCPPFVQFHLLVFCVGIETYTIEDIQLITDRIIERRRVEEASNRAGIGVVLGQPDWVGDVVTTPIVDGASVDGILEWQVSQVHVSGCVENVSKNRRNTA